MNILSYITDMLSDILYLIPAILIALTFHEWAHAFAAFKLGDPTARNLGRMSLNPMNHIDPIGLIMLLVVRFGWAKPVPINPRNFEHPRRDEIIVSLAGVVTNFLLAFVTIGLFFLLMVLGVNNDIVNTFLFMFYSINLGLCVFNLFPIPPLDGYHVAECLLIRKIGPQFFMTYERYGYVVLIVLIISGVLTRVMSFLTSGIASGMFTVWASLFSLFG